MYEFDLIRRYFSPLSKVEEGALLLRDDAAVVAPKAGMDLVYTKDLMIADVHFFAEDDPKELAQKLLAVNVSDLSAMGALPRGYLLGLALPKGIKEWWIARFAEGLGDAIQCFGGALLGGDTTAHKNKVNALVLSLTAIGEVERGKVLKRSGARIGDDVYVTGTIGDAAVGLRLLEDSSLEEVLSLEESSYLKASYYLPVPRQAWGAALQGLATACVDVSDGLVADAGHIASASDVALEISVDAVPISRAVESVISVGLMHVEQVLTGGDDYELLFTAPVEVRSVIEKLAKSLDVFATRIGKVKSGEGVQLVRNGAIVELVNKGYQHSF